MGETQGKQPQKELCTLKVNANYALDSRFSFSLRKKKKKIKGPKYKQELQTSGPFKHYWRVLSVLCPFHQNTGYRDGKNTGRGRLMVGLFYVGSQLRRGSSQQGRNVLIFRQQGPGKFSVTQTWFTVLLKACEKCSISGSPIPPELESAL